MKKYFLLLVLLFSIKLTYAQQKIKVGRMMLMQIHIPIQPDDKSWVHWNIMPSLQDSSKTIRIDRLAQGFAPIIAMHDAPYYSATQVKEIQTGLEKILNPEGYFATQKNL